MKNTGQDNTHIPRPEQVGEALFNAPPPRIIAPEGKELLKKHQNQTPSKRAKDYLSWYCLANPGARWDWCENDIVRGRVTWKTDLFGFADAMLIHNGWHAIQATGGSNGLARVKKITGEIQAGEKHGETKAANRRANALAWLRNGGTISVWDYRKRKKGGLVIEVERVVIPVTLEDFA